MKQPIGAVAAYKYKNLPCPIDPALAERVQQLLEAKGVKARLNPKVLLVHDIYMVR
jgi:NADPH-dependent 2,4-dienoyl-CoA reductase/sulfur reductase-like enzyme